ncbi:hypothetical protein KIN20_026464 [Parelaphostrongylus tenuis]|uniref:Uncharacterized protein n=1 Tax=Parelaphostrongylus tenuis TaxID=148309 RepID=A0AAD5QY28_PARTN|nr:hypothetical protein KIN20_026464 [Parelaphostrongylus tenuis]
MVPHFDDRDPLLMNSMALRRRISVVPVNHFEHRHNRPSIGSLEMFRSFKNKVERSLSRGHVHDEHEPRKTSSHGHLPILDFPRSHRSGETTPVREKSFTNGAFIDSQEDVNSSTESGKGKDVLTSSSHTNLKSAHDFPHHILDDVLEENEEEIGLKAMTKRIGTSEKAPVVEETKGTVEEKTNEGENKDTVLTMEADDDNESLVKKRTSEFFISHEDQR